MTTSFGRHKPVRAYVKPVASHQKQGINGTVTGQDDRALLSTSLTKKVLGFRSRSQRADGASSEPLYVSIEWAVDRRLGVAGSRSLVVAVEERDSVSKVASEDQGAPCLGSSRCMRADKY